MAQSLDLMFRCRGEDVKKPLQKLEDDVRRMDYQYKKASDLIPLHDFINHAISQEQLTEILARINKMLDLIKVIDNSLTGLNRKLIYWKRSVNDRMARRHPAAKKKLA